MRALSMLLAFLMLAALATPVMAQNDPNRVAADRLVQDGLLLARTKKFREAIKKFEDAFKLFPHPEIQHNLARAHEELGELVVAYDYFSQALQTDYTFASQGRERLTRIDTELRKTHARVTVRTTPSQSRVVLSFPDGTEVNHTMTPFAAWAPAGKTKVVASNTSFKTTEVALDLKAGEDREVNVTLNPIPRQGFVQVTVNLAGASVSLAGKPVGTSPLDSLAFEAGIYELVVTLKGYVPYRESVVVIGDQISSVNVILVSENPGRPPEIPSATATTWPGWVFVGTGVAAGGAALYLQLGEAKPLADQANALDPDPINDDKYDRLIANAKEYQTAAIITGIVGGVLATTGIILLVTADDTPESGAFTPTFGVSPEGAFVGGHLRF